ncbi:MAG: sugar phosphate isomerase/epimerase [Bacteroidales bacterium]|nr:sugar phosphate isomerase/epimerase [Bacteroidales bacterium]
MINRRQAIVSMAMGTGAAIIPASCVNQRKTEPGEKSHFYFSLNTSTISGNSPGITEYIDIASAAGYDYIEIWVRDLEAYLEKGNSAASLRSYAEDKGIKFVSAIGFAPWMTGGTSGFDQMKREMEMLANTGCPRIAAPPAGVDGSEPLDLFSVGERYARLLDLGKQTGVMPQLEFWGASDSLWHIGQVLMIAGAADHPDVKILPDVYHLFRGNSGFNSLKFINGNMIDLFHMNDYPGDIPRSEQTDADRVFPGDGVAPLKEILKDLINMGGDKVLSLELFNRTYWKEDALTVAKTGLQKMKEQVKSIE